MPENSKNPNTGNNEIDLLELLKKIFDFFGMLTKSIVNGILYCIVFVFRKWLPFGLSIILGIIVSVYLNKPANPVYISEITIRNNVISNSEMIAYINKLHNFCIDKNEEALKNSFSTTLDKIKAIQDIEAFWILDLNKDSIPDGFINNSDTSSSKYRMKDQFMVRIISDKPVDLSVVGDGIISFVQKNKVFVQKNTFRIGQIDEMLDRIKYDIKQLDSLQKVIYFENSRTRNNEKTGQLFFMQEQKTQLFYGDVYTLYTRKQALDKQKELNREIISVINDITFSSKPDNGIFSRGKNIVAIFILITLLILLIFEKRKYIKEIFKKYQ
jgi:hypothetical protein